MKRLDPAAWKTACDRLRAMSEDEITSLLRRAYDPDIDEAGLDDDEWLVVAAVAFDQAGLVGAELDAVGGAR